MKKIITVIVLLVAFALIFSCATTYKPKGPVSCNCEIKWEVTKQADVTAFSCAIAKWKKRNAVLFKFKIKNISDKPERFRIRITTAEGKSVGMLVPRKGKPPIIKPGEQKAGKLFMAQPFLPKKITVKVMILD
ncbi:MAG: hypothetical protein JRI44_00885 [Deltaproteobacteria bacterium]|nr:hypothetical protein [Deltaproteobacteria bacterium]